MKESRQSVEEGTVVVLPYGSLVPCDRPRINFLNQTDREQNPDEGQSPLREGRLLCNYITIIIGWLAVLQKGYYFRHIGIDVYIVRTTDDDDAQQKNRDRAKSSQDFRLDPLAPRKYIYIGTVPATCSPYSSSRNLREKRGLLDGFSVCRSTVY
jgi:hypothetical protein